MTDLERDWWNTLDGQDVIDNTSGVPPCDVGEVAAFIAEQLGDVTQSTLLLDLGCGPGRLTNAVAELFPWCTIVGNDISPKMIATAQAHCPMSAFQVCDGRTLPGTHLYAGGFSVTVFQHIPHEAVRGYLAQVRRRLLPGARFVFSYSAGDENVFLSHQIHDHDLVRWLGDAGFEEIRLLDVNVGHDEWSWALAGAL